MVAFDVFALLRSKIPELGNWRLADAEPILCDELGAVELRLRNSHDHKPHIHRKTLFKKAVEMADSVSITFSRDQNSSQTGQKDESVYPPLERRCATPSPSSFETMSTRNEPSGGVEFSEDFFIRELDRREKMHGPMKAVFLVNDLAPRLGFKPFQAKQIISQLEARGVIQTIKKPNPRNPEHPTTFVYLNREHSTVRSVLNVADEAGKGTFFEPVQVKGEPVSETIIRERR